MPTIVVVRTLHILLAALWVGAGVFLTVFLMPALHRLGPVGSPVLADIARRRMGVFMAAVASLTVLSGLWLYWEFTRGLQPTVVLTTPGMVFGLGGIAGVLAAVIGGAVIGRSLERVVALSARIPGMAEGPEKAAHVQMLGRLRQRAAVASRVDLVLLVTALLLMAMGHYV